MNNQSCTTGVMLDDLLALVEKSVVAVERLQAANAALTMQLRSHEAEARATASALEQTNRQIEELEHAVAALQKDAHWCRWFRDKYGGANFHSFFAYIEKEYRFAHPEMHDADAAEDAANHMPAPPLGNTCVRAS